VNEVNAPKFEENYFGGKEAPKTADLANGDGASAVNKMRWGQQK